MANGFLSRLARDQDLLARQLHDGAAL